MTTTQSTQWTDLYDVFPRGALEVWYMRPDWFPSGIMGDEPDPQNLEATHIQLGSIGSSPNEGMTSASFTSMSDLESIWSKLQGEFWSPNGEAWRLIQSKGLKHTSMSMGDCFRFANDDVYIVAAAGFKILN